MAIDIYGLYCPDTDELRYIGKANNYQKRFLSHIRDSRRRTTPVCVWIQSLIKKGKLPVIRLIVNTKEGGWQEAERDLILKHMQAGANLLNVAAGGNEPYCSTETRKLNGPRAVAARQANETKKRLWYLKMRISQSVLWLTKNGRAEAANRIINKLNGRGVVNGW